MTVQILKNSFISLEEADKYFSERLNSTLWENTDEGTKEKALISATNSLNLFNYIGYKKDDNQPLAFPRVLTRVFPMHLIEPDVPIEIKQAVCEEAITLLEIGHSPHLKNQQLGINSINIGAGTVSYNQEKKNLLSEKALFFAEKYFRKGAHFV